MDQNSLMTTQLVGRLHPVPAAALALIFAILCVFTLSGLQRLASGSSSSAVQIIEQVAGIVLVTIVLPIGFFLPFTLKLQITIHHREHHVIRNCRIYGMQAFTREYFADKVLVKKNRSSGLHGGSSSFCYVVSVVENGVERPVLGSVQSTLFGGLAK